MNTLAVLKRDDSKGITIKILWAIKITVLDDIKFLVDFLHQERYKIGFYCISCDIIAQLSSYAPK